jgi:hypothetical protein
MIWLNLRGLDVPGADRLCKPRLVVGGNPRRVGRDNGAGNAASRSLENEPAAEVHARERLSVCVLGRVAICTTRNRYQVFPAFSVVERWDSGTRVSSGPGTLRIRHFTGKIRLVGGCCLRTGGSDRKYTIPTPGPRSTRRGEIQVRHKGKERSAAVADAFTDGARQLVVAPIARAGFWIRGVIRRINLSRETLEDAHVLACAERLRQNGRMVRCPVMLRVTTHALGYALGQVFAPRQARRGALEPPRCEDPQPRSDEWPPSYRERDCCDQNDSQRDKHPHRNFPEFFHLIKNVRIQLHRGSDKVARLFASIANN